jgi:hypothetical protein
MLVQRFVWRRIEAPTDPDESATPQKLLERLTRNTDPGEFISVLKLLVGRWGRG